jgi:hypothetical protein
VCAASELSVASDVKIRALQEDLEAAHQRIRELEQAVTGIAPAPAGTEQTEPDRRTEHTCNQGRGPFWGNLTPDCPRCDQLARGEEPWQLPEWRRQLIERADQRRLDDEERAAAIWEHFKPGGAHSRKVCGPVCTFGDW